MRNVKDAYLHLGRKLINEVKDDNGDPAVHHVDLWYEQTEFPELADGIDYPALFFDFTSSDISTIGLFEQDVDLVTNIYVASDSLDDTHLEAAERGDGLHYLELCARVHELLEGYAHPNCGNLTRIGFAGVSTRTNLLVYRLTYASVVRDHSAMEKRRDTVPGEVELAFPAKTDAPTIFIEDNTFLVDI
jgi:hypothetical protein